MFYLWIPWQESSPSLHRGEEKALQQFQQGSGPVTSCMPTFSESGRNFIPLIYVFNFLKHLGGLFK